MEVVELKCTHKVCKNCYDSYRENGGNVCPLCRTKIRDSDLIRYIPNKVTNPRKLSNAIPRKLGILRNCLNTFVDNKPNSKYIQFIYGILWEINSWGKVSDYSQLDNYIKTLDPIKYEDSIEDYEYITKCIKTYIETYDLNDVSVSNYKDNNY